MTRRNISGIAAIHEKQRLELLATANVPETIVPNIHWHQFFQSRKLWQAAQRSVVNKLATHGQSFQ
jgi:hypothetical protein